jgi:hypothetical protein
VSFFRAAYGGWEEVEELRSSGNGDFPGYKALEDWELQDCEYVQSAVYREFGLLVSIRSAWDIWSDYSGICYAASWLIGCCPEMSVKGALEELMEYPEGEPDYVGHLKEHYMAMDRSEE